jgi:hypothetical protein
MTAVGATMPIAAVNKHNDSLLVKDKVRRTDDILRVTFPPFEFVFPQQ